MGLFSKDIKTMNDLFVHALRDIYYAENQILKALPEMIEKATDAQLKQAFQSHLAETKNHAESLKTLLEQFSGSASTLKDMTAKLAATAQGVTGMLISDEVVKGMMASYAFEHTEIATYRVLIAAADEIGEDQATALFERILAEEIAMAEWLGDNLDGITRVFLMRDERDLQAKR